MFLNEHTPNPTASGLWNLIREKGKSQREGLGREERDLAGWRFPGVGRAPGAGNLDSGLFAKRLAGLGLPLSLLAGRWPGSLPHAGRQLLSPPRWLFGGSRPGHQLPAGGSVPMYGGGRQHGGVGGCVVLDPRLQFGQK